MIEIKKVRIYILILLILLVGGTTLFVGRAANQVFKTKDVLLDMEKHAQISREDFVELSIVIQETFLKTIEDNWQAELSFYYSTDAETAVKRLNQQLDGVMNQAYNSLIVAFKDENGLVYVGYEHDEYKAHLHRLNWEDIEVKDEPQIFFDDGSAAGEGSRIYVSSTKLDALNKQIDVFVLFEESIMLGAMIESYDLFLLDEASDNIERILLIVTIYMILVIVITTAITLFLRKLYVDTNSKCPYFGNKLCYAQSVITKGDEAKNEA